MLLNWSVLYGKTRHGVDGTGPISKISLESDTRNAQILLVKFFTLAFLFAPRGFENVQL
jgi:hypothetical protein